MAWIDCDLEFRDDALVALAHLAAACRFSAAGPHYQKLIKDAMANLGEWAEQTGIADEEDAA